MTGRSTVILEEGKITGSFIKVYCNIEKGMYVVSELACLLFKTAYKQLFRAFWKNKAILPLKIMKSNHASSHYQILHLQINYEWHPHFHHNKNTWTQKSGKHTWIGSRNSSGISPRVASASIASEAATLALAPSWINSCIILPSSPILWRTSAPALNNCSELPVRLHLLIW